MTAGRTLAANPKSICQTSPRRAVAIVIFLGVEGLEALQGNGVRQIVSLAVGQLLDCGLDFRKRGHKRLIAWRPDVRKYPTGQAPVERSGNSNRGTDGRSYQQRSRRKRG